MSEQCTIVMYHYVRELRETTHPKIRGLNVSDFKEQLAYMQRFYQFITVKDLLDGIYRNTELPENSALLTFDDGYSDHFENVFPILDDLGIHAAFFPPVSAVVEGKVLDVNKIQFILASVASPWQLVEEVYEQLDKLRSQGESISPNDELFDKLALRGAFDPPEIIFLKRLLQRELPMSTRSAILAHLFAKHVTEDELAFARDLYMNSDQLSMLVRSGMVVGSHGDKHLWMNTLSSDEQRAELESSIRLLKRIGSPEETWLMCYPYGAHDDSLINLLLELGFKAGLTTEFDIAKPNLENAMTLPRLDTNHLPKDRRSEANSWTKQVI